MIVYGYSKKTGEYIGQEEVMLDPIDNLPMVPAACSIDAPPEEEGSVAVFEDGHWVLKEDHRGQVFYNQTTGEPLEISELGPIPAGYEVAPPTPTLDELRTAKQAEIKSGADSVLKALAAEYPDMEMVTWDQQYQEALAYTADPTSETPLLTAIAQGRGMSVADLAARIIANRAAWVALSGAIVGQRLAYQDALDAATTTEEVEAISVNYSV